MDRGQSVIGSIPDLVLAIASRGLRFYDARRRFDERLRRTINVYEGAITYGLTTDNGNLIIDVHGLTILDPVAMETKIGALVGVGDRGSALTAARHSPTLQLAARAA
jgi:ribose 5-phosphate isomerase